MYTRDEFRKLMCSWVSDHEFPVVVEYEKISKEHEYHMMQFLLMNKDAKEAVAKDCETSMQTLFLYFLDWDSKALIVGDQMYSDRHIGAALYCFLEFFDVVYGRKTYFPESQRTLMVSDYLIIVDKREAYKPDPVLVYAKESRFHTPHISVFDEPAVRPEKKSEMRLLAKHIGLSGRRLWTLYCPYDSHHVSDWKSLFTYATERLNTAKWSTPPNDTLPIGLWSRSTGKLFNPSGEWRKEFLKTSDPCYFEEDHPVVRGDKFVAPVDSIRIKELM